MGLLFPNSESPLGFSLLKEMLRIQPPVIIHVHFYFDIFKKYGIFFCLSFFYSMAGLLFTWLPATEAWRWFVTCVLPELTLMLSPM